MLTLNKFITFLILVLFSKFCFSISCDYIRNFNITKQNLNEYLTMLNKEIKENNLCAKNALGVLYAKGDFVKKDNERAYAIFYDLTQQEYAPSFLNLGIMLVRSDKPFDISVPNFLLNSYATFIQKKDTSEIAVSSKDLGYEYFSKYSGSENEKLFKDYDDKVKEISYLFTVEKNQNNIKSKETADAIFAIAAIGIGVSKLSSITKSASTNYSYRTNNIVAPRPQFYSVYPTNSNYLYLMPHY